MNNVLQNLMRRATRLTQAGRLTEATATIQRALSGKTNNYDVVADQEAPVKPAPSALILDDCVFEVADAFTSGSHTHATLTRGYKLYVPTPSTGQARPLVVMLHGCTQNPDDFALGTGMNERAHEQGFCVLYPEQSQAANPQRCWNWFKHNHQRRGSGEPALIASMTQTIIKEHDIDPRRVFIAGLSAGGAMAAIVADAYPEIFAAVGVHSGLPTGAASNVAEALAVMSSGQSGNGMSSAQATKLPQRLVPTIVFHGDQDRTVHPRNGEQVIASALGSAAATSPQVTQGVSPNGRRYTSATHHGETGKVLAEHWLVHGAGHAWSGGHAKGSYTDAKGPDATAEMLRFFFAHPHAA
jgi:poly(hydroxyalkanoate) depolymerase family esterase